MRLGVQHLWGFFARYFYFLPRRGSTLGKTACLLYLSCIQLVMPFQGHRITGNYWLCHLRYFTIRKCSKWFTATGKWYPMCLGFELLGGFLGTSCPQWQGCRIQLLKNTKPYLLLAYKRFQPSENQTFETFVSTTECALDLESKCSNPSQTVGCITHDIHESNNGFSSIPMYSSGITLGSAGSPSFLWSISEVGHSP